MLVIANRFKNNYKSSKIDGTWTPATNIQSILEEAGLTASSNCGRNAFCCSRALCRKTAPLLLLFFRLPCKLEE